LQIVFAQPVGIQRICRHESVAIDPAMERMHRLPKKKSIVASGVEAGERPDLPRLIHGFEEKRCGSRRATRKLGARGRAPKSKRFCPESKSYRTRVRSGLLFRIGPGEEKFLAIMGGCQFGAVRRSNLLQFAAAKNNVSRRIQVGDSNGRLEVGNGWGGGLLFVGIFVVIGLILNLREEFGGDAGAAS